MAVAHQDPSPSPRTRVAALLQALHLEGPLDALHDAAPSTHELGELREYRRAAGLWRHLQAGGYTMLGSRRARALRRMARACDQDNVPGAFVDCGCFNGGSSVMMSSSAPSREVWAFDSFQGLPEAGPRDPDSAHDLAGELVASERKVREAFSRFAFPERLHVVKGWFAETFPEVAPAIKQVAIVHADGDWYESVRLTLETFEPKVSPGGFVVIDDYGFWEGAKEATHEYRASRGIDASLVEVDQTAVFWRKPRELKL